MFSVHSTVLSKIYIFFGIAAGETESHINEIINVNTKIGYLCQLQQQLSIWPTVSLQFSSSLFPLWLQSVSVISLSLFRFKVDILLLVLAALLGCLRCVHVVMSRMSRLLLSNIIL